jgi:hypothetical protein
MRVDVATRFWAKVDRSGECWLWTAYTDPLGYGRFAVRPDGKRRTLLAHRFAYEQVVGPIPRGLTIDHLCRNPSCVNPKHLEPVPIAENLRRGEGVCAQNSRKTHCKHGHEFTPENTYVRAERNGRECRECLRKASREWHRRRAVAALLPMTPERRMA